MDKMPVVDSHEGAVSLPIYTRMTDADQSRVIEAVKASISG